MGFIDWLKKLFGIKTEEAAPAAPAKTAEPAPKKAAPAAKKPAAKKPAAKPAAKKPAAKDDDEKRPQCLAITAAGGQCRNSARAGSKYCSRHKGYRVPSKAVAAKAEDTEPVVKKAKDTAPSARRTQYKVDGYKLFQNGNRYFFSKKAAKDVSGKPVYALPKDRKVVKTPNGLPVLKKKD